MEKALSPEERIRRAEEIYYRRKMSTQYKNYARVNVSKNKKDFGLLKKMILQILICIVIYVIFYMIQNTNYIFSEDVIEKTKEILSYDINVQSLYNKAKDYLDEFVMKYEILNTEQNNNEQEQNTETINEETVQEIQNEEINSENIGGENIEEPITLTQMQQDAKDILNSKSLIIPLSGVITSRFGQRESNNPIVSKNHTGIDIAANEGTVFIASMSGTVELVSSEGDLGNHIKITSGNVATVYAHCKQIYVKQGEEITQGEKIGEVGQTRQ
ncbi:MAG: M23 family metallopeptidase [Clostridia bacterium]|nr:M23 family metallopeptidase [Clostridia bacterium]